MASDFDADFRNANDGSAIALALQDPYLTGSEHFGFKVNWGTYSGSNALGVTVTGNLYYDPTGMGPSATFREIAHLDHAPKLHASDIHLVMQEFLIAT